MGLFNKKKESTSRNNGGISDVIRCDEPSYLIWKWHPEGSKTGNNSRENSIRWGSSLRVKDGEVAVFVYKQKNGSMQDFIEGPFDQIIQTKNFPVLSSIIGLAYQGKTPFQAEIYFINLSRVIQIPFAVPYFDLYDPRYLDIGIPTAVRGIVTFNIADYQKFIKMHRLQNFNLEEFQQQTKAAIIRYVKGTVANVPINNNIPVVQIERYLADINDIVEKDLQEKVADNHGINIVSVDISAIDVDKASIGYQRLKSLTEDITAAKAKIQAAVDIRNMEEMQKINIENTRESMRVQREEAQYAQHMQTRSANISAYQTEKQADVAMAGADALGKINKNGVGDVSNNGSMNPTAMMTSMAMGGAIGQNMASMMNNMMQGVGSQTQSVAQPIMTPPPVPNVAYYVALNGKPAGPFGLNELSQMVSEGTLTTTSLVWKQGMLNWVEAQGVQELEGLFHTNIPPILNIPPIPPSK